MLIDMWHWFIWSLRFSLWRRLRLSLQIAALLPPRVLLGTGRIKVWVVLVTVVVIGVVLTKPSSRIRWPFSDPSLAALTWRNWLWAWKAPMWVIVVIEYVHLVLINLKNPQFIPLCSTETKGWSLSAPSLRSRKYRQRYHSLRVID